MLPRRNRFIDNNDNKWEAFDTGGHYVHIAFSIFINAAINLSLRLLPFLSSLGIFFMPYLIQSFFFFFPGTIGIQQTRSGEGDLLPLYILWTSGGILLTVLLLAGLGMLCYWQRRKDTDGSATKLANKGQEVEDLTSPKMALLSK